MLPLTALIIADEPAVRFAGLELTERAARAARRAGIEHVHIVGDDLPSPRTVRRLRAFGLTVTCALLEDRPFRSAPVSARTVVQSAATLIEPSGLMSLLAEEAPARDDAMVVVDTGPETRHRFVRVADGRVAAVLTDGNASSMNIAVLPASALAEVRGARSFADALHRLAGLGRLRAVSVAPHFCARLHSGRYMEAPAASSRPSLRAFPLFSPRRWRESLEARTSAAV